MIEPDSAKWAQQVTDAEWARQVRELGTTERTRRIDAVTVLLDEPSGLSVPLESELHILLTHLREQAG